MDSWVRHYLCSHLWMFVFLGVAGVQSGYKFTFIALFPAAMSLFRQIFTVKFDEPQSCLAKFKWNAYVTGFLISVGFIAAKYFEI